MTRFAWFVRGIDLDVAYQLTGWPREWDAIALEALQETGLDQRPETSEPPEEIEVYDVPPEAVKKFGLHASEPMLLFILEEAGMAMLASPAPIYAD